jgi:hypothetical protein
MSEKLKTFSIPVGMQLVCTGEEKNYSCHVTDDPEKERGAMSDFDLLSAYATGGRYSSVAVQGSAFMETGADGFLHVKTRGKLDEGWCAERPPETSPTGTRWMKWIVCGGVSR